MKTTRSKAKRRRLLREQLQRSQQADEEEDCNGQDGVNSIALRSAPSLRCRSFVDELGAFYRLGTFCDAEVVCGDGAVVRCHRLVLAAISSTASDMLGDSAPGDDDVATVFLPDHGSDAVRHLLDGAYGCLADESGLGGASSSELVALESLLAALCAEITPWPDLQPRVFLDTLDSATDFKAKEFSLTDDKTEMKVEAKGHKDNSFEASETVVEEKVEVKPDDEVHEAQPDPPSSPQKAEADQAEGGGVKKLSKKAYSRETYLNFECGCDETFASDSLKIRHVKLVHTDYYDACPHCLKLFTKKGYKDYDRVREAHMEATHNRKTCDACGAEASGKSGLAIHMALVHPERATNQRVLASKLARQGTCKECGVWYKNLRAHVNIKHSSRKYSCDRCGMAFATPSILKRHVLSIHADMEELSHACPHCSKRFATPDRRKNHILGVHVKMGHCLCRYEGCDKRYNDVGSRANHEKLSHGRSYWQAAKLGLVPPQPKKNFTPEYYTVARQLT